MNPIINNTNFVGEFYVANPTGLGVAASLNNIVAINQEKYLRELLGPIYYERFAEWYDTAVADRPSNETFEKLLTGTTFTSTWGIVMYMPPIAEPLKAYCYNAWNERNATQTVAMGEVETESQNAAMASATLKVVARWNDMVSNTIATWEWLNKQLKNESDWTTWVNQARWYYTQGIYKRKNRLDL